MRDPRYHTRFQKLEKEHVATHQKLLQSILQNTNVNQIVAGTEDTTTGPARAADPIDEKADPKVELKTYESLQAVGEEVAARCASEVAGVELIKTTSGKLLLMSDRKRIIAKQTLIGGFGTGKHLSSKTYVYFLKILGLCFCQQTCNSFHLQPNST